MIPDKPLLEKNGFFEALARFKQASLSSYLVLAWQTEVEVPISPSLTSVKSASTSTMRPKRKNTNNITLPNPQIFKTSHTYTAEGKILGFNLEALKKYLNPDSHFHILLRAKDDVVLIQQMAGASVGNKRKKALAATRSLIEVIPYVTVTVKITELDELDEILLQFDTNPDLSLGSSLSKAGSIMTLPGKVSKIVARYELTDKASSYSANKLSPTASSWTSEKATLSNSQRMSSISSSFQSSDTVFLECEESSDSLKDDKEKKLIKEEVKQVPQEAIVILPPKKEVRPERPLPPLPQPGPTASLQKSINVWMIENDASSGTIKSKEEQSKSDCVRMEEEKARLRQQADELKREQVMKKLIKEQNTWESGIPSYYDKYSDTAVKSINIQQRGSERGGKRLAPLSTPPPLLLPPSPRLLSFMATSPIVLASSHNKYTFPLQSGRVDLSKNVDDQSHPDFTVEGRLRSRSRSKSLAGRFDRKFTQKETEALHLSTMPPFVESLEMARKKIKDMQDSDLEGESWINKRQRERSESDAQVLAVNKGWSLMVEKEMPPLPPAQDDRKGKGSEALQTRHQLLCLQLSKMQKIAADIDAAERLIMIRWAGDEFYRRGLDAFERSQRESTERKRRQEAEVERNVIRLKVEEVQKDQREVMTLIKESAILRGKVEHAKRERLPRMQSKDGEKQQKLLQEQVRLKVKAERRADLRVELQTSIDTILARGLITVQSEDGIRKRRRYELHCDELLLFQETRSATLSVTDSMELPLARITVEPGSIISIRDDSEMSQASHSFFIKYLDNEKNTMAELLAYTDTEAEKERLLIALAMLSCYKLNDDTFKT